MGLDFSNCEARWAYSGFMRFRTRLATEVGITLSCMEGFASGPTGKTFKTLIICGEQEGNNMPGFEKYVGRQEVIPWKNVKDNIKYLLNHSDCEGILTPKECAKVAPRLRKLVSHWTEDDRDRISALILADGMDLAASNNENLEFC